MGRTQIATAIALTLLVGCATNQQTRPSVGRAPPAISTHQADSADTMETEMERTGNCLRERLAESKVNTLRVLVYSARQSIGTSSLPDLQVPFDYRPQVEIVLAKLGLKFIFVQENKVPAEMRRWLGKRAPTLILRSSLDGMSGLIASETRSKEWHAGFGGGRGEGSVSSQMISEAVSGSVHASTTIYRLVMREDDLSDAEYYGIQAAPVKVTYQRLTNSRDYGADVYVLGGGTSIRRIKVFGGTEAALLAIRWSVMEALAGLIGLKLNTVCTVRASAFDLTTLTTYNLLRNAPAIPKNAPAAAASVKSGGLIKPHLKKKSCVTRRNVKSKKPGSLNCGQNGKRL